MDESAVLALNGANEAETSPLDAGGLRALLEQAFHVGLCEEGRAAFLIAFDQDAVYASPNFRWFQARNRRFVYIDRIIVSRDRRGLGLARSLYEELFAAATAAGHELVGCEVNLEPPNPNSDAFHLKLGFNEVGRATLHPSGKVVRYLEKAL
jgi:uncharacterized protein